MERILHRLCDQTNQKEMFVASGQWSNGLLAYSKLTLNPLGMLVIYDNDNCAYYQQRINGHLVMFHI